MTRSSYVLLDRDGVVTRDLPGSVRRTEDLSLIPEALKALAILKQHGIRVIIITNQACVGRGDVSLETLEAIHTKLRHEVEANGGHIEAIFVCPHTDEDACDCRKPAPGLILTAQGQYGFALSNTYFVGDDLLDLQAGAAAGCLLALVRTGKGASISPPKGTAVFDDVLAFAYHVVG